jgi:hypothetical protein
LHDPATPFYVHPQEMSNSNTRTTHHDHATQKNIIRNGYLVSMSKKEHDYTHHSPTSNLAKPIDGVDFSHARQISPMISWCGSVNIPVEDNSYKWSKKIFKTQAAPQF